MSLRAFGVSDRGPARASNEDCFGIHEDVGLCVVADGMGGHNAGEVAARIAVDVIVQHIRTNTNSTSAENLDPAFSVAGRRLHDAVLRAHARIVETAADSPAYAGMGTTVVAALVDAGRLTVAHVGDSRLYLRSPDGFRAMTTDDSWIATMIARDPGSDPQRYRSHPMRNALTNVVGGRTRPTVHIAETPLADGDLVLLTTDGVHGVVEDERLDAL